MTLPVPAPTDPVADTYKYINDLRTAARAAILNINFVAITGFSAVPNGQGRFTFTVPGLTSVAGVVFQHMGTATITVIVRSIVGATVQADIWITGQGKNDYASSLYTGPVTLFGFAWGVK